MCKWQTCPKCEGEKQVYYPCEMTQSGDITGITIFQGNKICPVCNGAGVISKKKGTPPKDFKYPATNVYFTN